MDHNEENELHKLSHEITRLITRVDYHEKEIEAHRKDNDGRFAKLEKKLDELSDAIGNIKGDVRELIIKLGFFGLIGMFAIQLIGKHFGWF